MLQSLIIHHNMLEFAHIFLKCVESANTPCLTPNCDAQISTPDRIKQLSWIFIDGFNYFVCLLTLYELIQALWQYMVIFSQQLLLTTHSLDFLILLHSLCRFQCFLCYTRVNRRLELVQKHVLAQLLLKHANRWNAQ